jgi:hypothetical protein
VRGGMVGQSEVVAEPEQEGLHREKMRFIPGTATPGAQR